jgi:hypothetical protein
MAFTIYYGPVDGPFTILSRGRGAPRFQGTFNSYEEFKADNAVVPEAVPEASEVELDELGLLASLDSAVKNRLEE